MNGAIDMYQRLRHRIHAAATGFSEAQLFAIPDGFRNNIAWNIGHLVVTQQLLHYPLSGLEMYIDDATVAQFRKGSSPQEWETRPSMVPIFDAIEEMPRRLGEDFERGRFTTFTEYKTSAGVVLRSFEDALHFNNFHEGIHLGVILSLAKIV